MNTNTAILYARVSSEDQVRHGVSLDNQEEKLRAYATVAGLEVIELVREEGVSAGIALSKRPEGCRVVQALNDGRARHIVALKLDRVFRCAVDALSQTRIWDKAGIRLHLVDMGGAAVDTGSAMGRFFLSVLAGFAELERGLISERTTAALRYKREQGKVYGHVPLGFERIGDHLVPDSKEQNVIQYIQDLRSAGISFSQIAQALNRDEIPTKRGGLWHPFSVQSLLRRLARDGLASPSQT